MCSPGHWTAGFLAASSLVAIKSSSSYFPSNAAPKFGPISACNRIIVVCMDNRVAQFFPLLFSLLKVNTFSYTVQQMSPRTHCKYGCAEVLAFQIFGPLATFCQKTSAGTTWPNIVFCFSKAMVWNNTFMPMWSMAKLNLQTVFREVKIVLL